jgi:hypothetical protein
VFLAEGSVMTRRTFLHSEADPDDPIFAPSFTVVFGVRGERKTGQSASDESSSVETDPGPAAAEDGSQREPRVRRRDEP